MTILNSKCISSFHLKACNDDSEPTNSTKEPLHMQRMPGGSVCRIEQPRDGLDVDRPM